jgi:hypothetical protein
VFANFLIDLRCLGRKLPHVADAEYLWLRNFRIYSKHGADGERSCLARSVFALGNQIDMDPFDWLHDQGYRNSLNIGGSLEFTFFNDALLNFGRYFEVLIFIPGSLVIDERVRHILGVLVFHKLYTLVLLLSKLLMLGTNRFAVVHLFR